MSSPGRGLWLSPGNDVVERVVHGSHFGILMGVKGAVNIRAWLQSANSGMDMLRAGRGLLFGKLFRHRACIFRALAVRVP